MHRNWISRLAGKYRRSEVHNRPVDRDVDVERVHSELDAIRARFPDHA